MEQYDINKYVDTQPVFQFDGIDVHALAKKLTTPFYVMSSNLLEYNYGHFVSAFSGLKNFKVYFSVKTNFESEVLKKLKQLGAGMEIAGELDLLSVERAGVSPDEIVVDGPIKSDALLGEAISKKFHRINIESMDEMNRVNELSKKQGVITSVGVRIDPLVTNNYYDTVIDTYKRKFGFQIHDALEQIRETSKFGNLKIEGLHANIGSQLITPKFHVKSLKKLMLLAMQLKQDGVAIKEINIGGGYPAVSMKSIRVARRIKISSILEKIGLFEMENPSIYDFGKEISGVYARMSKEYGIEPSICSEPGRFLVSNIMMLVGQIVLKKRKWIFTDISKNNIGDDIFFAERRIEIANKIKEAKTQRINLAGPTLCTADVIGINVKAPAITVGDTIAVLDVGAYCLARSNQFTRPRIAAYCIKNGAVHLMRKAETPADVLMNQEW